MAVNSETGALTDIKALSKAVKAKNPKTLVHCDAVQAFGRIRLNPKAMGIDLLSASGHKINAPKGVGMLYMAQGVRLVPLIHGSSQEGGLHPGTEHVPNIAAFGLAAEKMDRSREKLWKQYTALKEELTEKLEQMDGVYINSPQNAVPYILNLSVPGYRPILHPAAFAGLFAGPGTGHAECGQKIKTHYGGDYERDHSHQKR